MTYEVDAEDIAFALQIPEPKVREILDQIRPRMASHFSIQGKVTWRVIRQLQRILNKDLTAEERYELDYWVVELINAYWDLDFKPRGRCRSC